MKQVSRLAPILILLALLPALAPAQSPTAVPTLDLNRFILPWYEIERFTPKNERTCASDALMLFALGDKKNTIQIVTSCTQKNGQPNNWNYAGKASKSGNGELKISKFLFLHNNYWVLALDPDYNWALLGSPNHKFLWVLAKSATLTPDVLASIESKAKTAGFDTTRLVNIPQTRIAETVTGTPQPPQATPQRNGRSLQPPPEPPKR